MAQSPGLYVHVWDIRVTTVKPTTLVMNTEKAPRKDSKPWAHRHQTETANSLSVEDELAPNVL